MNRTTVAETHTDAGFPTGFIAFCETNLRYEKGPKAWLILGPYLLGAFLLEGIITTSAGSFATKLTLWGILLTYLILFPEVWRRILKGRKLLRPSAPSVKAR